MVKHLVLIVLFAGVGLLALPAPSSADHGAAHGGRECVIDSDSRVCFSGGFGAGGRGGRLEAEAFGFLSITSSGGEGQGGGGGRTCGGFVGAEECTSGGGRSN